MKKNALKVLFLWVVAAALVASPAAAVDSGVASVSLNASLPAALTVSVVSGSSVNFTLANNAIATGDVPVQVQTSWNVNPGLTTSVKLFGYFDTPTAALTDGAGNNIPTSKVEGRMTTGDVGSFTPFTQTNSLGTAGGSLKLFEETVTGANKIKTRTDNLELRINLTGTTLPAGTYAGVLRLQAQAL
jgi:hypothetical protein